MDIFGTLSSVVSAAKLAKTAADRINNAEMQMQLAELMSLLADLKLECANLSMENTDLKKQLQEERDANQNPPELDGDVFFFKDDYGPCCTKCWDSERKKILLKERSEQHRMAFFYDTPLSCPNCNTGHHGPSDEE